MKKVFTTIKGRNEEDDLRACVASMLELPIEAVPHFTYLPHGKRGNSMKIFTSFLDAFGIEYADGKKVFDSEEDLKNAEVINGCKIVGIFGEKSLKLSYVLLDENNEIIHNPNKEVTNDTLSLDNLERVMRLKRKPIVGKYTDEVNFSKTGQYGCGSEEEDDVYTIEEFAEHCECGAFIDYDGCGYPVKDSKADRSNGISPSTYKFDMPDDATHVVWFNR